MFNVNHIKLRKKLGPFETLPLYVPHINELFALLSGVKPIIFDTVRPENIAEICKVCVGFKLHVQPFEDKELQAGRTFILIGKDRKLLKKAARHYQNQHEEYMQWGTALGYPACCVEAIKQWRNARSALKNTPDIVKFVFNNTPRHRRLPFYTNNVFNYFSRPGRHSRAGYDEKDRHQGHLVSQLNSHFTFSLLPIISWHPCSYFCAESLKNAKTVFEMMSSYVPEFAEERKQALSKPVLFMDKYEFAVFNGIARETDNRGVEIRYNGLFPLHSLMGKKQLALLKKNSVISQNGMSLKLGGKIIKPASLSDQTPLLLPFTDKAD